MNNKHVHADTYIIVGKDSYLARLLSASTGLRSTDFKPHCTRSSVEREEK